MRYNILALIPEIVLLVTIVIAAVAEKFREKATPKTFYTISKIGLFLALVATIVFYNQSFLSGYYENNSFTTLIKVIIYLWMLGCFYLSLRWFLGMDRPSFRFYTLTAISVLLLTAAVSAYNLLLLYVLLESAFLLNYFLIKTEADETTFPAAKNFLIAAVGFAVLGGWGVWALYDMSGSFDFEAIRKYLTGADVNIRLYTAAAAILISLLFKIGAAPFHFWTAEAAGNSILPVSGYLTLVPIFAYYACLIKLVLQVLMPVYEIFEPVMVGFAAVSVIIGAVGTNSEQNLRRLFDYAALFNIGVMLAVLADFDKESVFSSLIYLLVYIMALSGIYTGFYAFKSKGDYLYMLRDVSGISESRPFIAASMLIFMVSLLGFPPFLGFIGLVSVLNDLVHLRGYWMIVIVLAGILMTGYAYLNVIKTLYFDAKVSNFDRADKGVYICQAVNILLVVIIVLNPKSVMGGIVKLLW